MSQGSRRGRIRRVLRSKLFWVFLAVGIFIVAVVTKILVAIGIALGILLIVILAIAPLLIRHD